MLGGEDAGLPIRSRRGGEGGIHRFKDPSPRGPAQPPKVFPWGIWKSSSPGGRSVSTPRGRCRLEPTVEDQPPPFPPRDSASMPCGRAEGGAPLPPPPGSGGAETPGTTASAAQGSGDQKGSARAVRGRGRRAGGGAISGAGLGGSGGGVRGAGTGAGPRPGEPGVGG